MHFLSSDAGGWDGCDSSNGYFRRTLAAPAKDFCQVKANANVSGLPYFQKG